MPSSSSFKLVCKWRQLAAAVHISVSADYRDTPRLLQFVQESNEYKQELQRGRHGALFQMMQDFNKVILAPIVSRIILTYQFV